jgi:hypothetical protein
MMQTRFVLLAVVPGLDLTLENARQGSIPRRSGTPE